MAITKARGSLDLVGEAVVGVNEAAITRTSKEAFKGVDREAGEEGGLAEIAVVAAAVGVTLEVAVAGVTDLAR